MRRSSSAGLSQRGRSESCIRVEQTEGKSRSSRERSESEGRIRNVRVLRRDRLSGHRDACLTVGNSSGRDGVGGGSGRLRIRGRFSQGWERNRLGVSDGFSCRVRGRVAGRDGLGINKRVADGIRLGYGVGRRRLRDGLSAAGSVRLSGLIALGDGLSGLVASGDSLSGLVALGDAVCWLVGLRGGARVRKSDGLRRKARISRGRRFGLSLVRLVRGAGREERGHSIDDIRNHVRSRSWSIRGADRSTSLTWSLGSRIRGGRRIRLGRVRSRSRSRGGKLRSRSGAWEEYRAADANYIQRIACRGRGGCVS